MSWLWRFSPFGGNYLNPPTVRGLGSRAVKQYLALACVLGFPATAPVHDRPSPSFISDEFTRGVPSALFRFVMVESAPVRRRPIPRGRPGRLSEGNPKIESKHLI
jgi:hypothetical protein